MYSLILSLCLFGQSQIKFYSFHADWCGPCVRMQQTTFKNKSVIKKIEDNFDFKSIDVDIEKELVKKYRIRAYPTQIFIYNGKIVRKIVGYRNSIDLLEEMDTILEEIKNE